MKKFGAVWASLYLAAWLCLGCGHDKILSKPKDINLEFWIAQNVTDYDFGDHAHIPGMFGGEQYYGKGYGPMDGDLYERPEVYVIYTLTAYPDYSDNGLFVTRIEIADPEISVYGLSCTSSIEDFDRALEALGATLETRGTARTATVGKSGLTLSRGQSISTLTVWVQVTNKHGIDF